MSIIMGVAKPLDKEITHYLGSFAREEEAWVDDKAYIAEMDKRFKELETGKVKGLTIDELAAKARQANKSRKRKKL